MKVSFNLTKKDCFNLNFYILKRYFLLNFLVLIVVSFILGIITKRFSFDFIVGSIIYSIVIAFIFFLILLFIVLFRICFSSSYKVGVLCEHVIEIDDEGFTESTSVNRDFCVWSSIYKVKQNKKYIFIFISKYKCHAIPKNSFNSFGALNYFYGSLVSFWNKNKLNKKIDITC
ncbi:YcxB family protein [Clostridium chromiireducens]|uniref:YcxB family protein n=1 Tax=Clostridium chromiireducens TaxID=225345 RepID=A0A399INY1_9CLOT|nr:YcxB family protein [Clostridium chromiireducens]RII34730.1 YcxB family protein [Clostridium chromiireducens]